MMKSWINRFENIINIKQNEILTQENKELKKQLNQAMNLIEERKKLFDDLINETIECQHNNEQLIKQNTSLLKENTSLVRMLNKYMK